MARTKKKDQPDVPKPGHNQMPPEMVRQYAAEIVAFDKDIDAERLVLNKIIGARRAKLKSFKSNGGDQDLLCQVIRELKLDPEELQLRIKTLNYYRETLNLGKIPGGDLVDQAVAADYLDKLHALGLRLCDEGKTETDHDYPLGSDEAKAISAGFHDKLREKLSGGTYAAAATRQEWLERMKAEDAAEGDEAEADESEPADKDEGQEAAKAGAETGAETGAEPKVEADDGKPLDAGWDQGAPGATSTKH